MYGIYIADDGRTNYAGLIAKGIKLMETRRRDVFKSLPEFEKLALIRTRRGHKPEIVGYVRMQRGYHCPADLFHLFDSSHMVKPGSKYDTDEHGKYLYLFTWCEELPEPLPLPEHINHGRSYTEFKEA